MKIVGKPSDLFHIFSWFRFFWAFFQVPLDPLILASSFPVRDCLRTPQRCTDGLPENPRFCYVWVIYYLLNVFLALDSDHLTFHVAFFLTLDFELPVDNGVNSWTPFSGY